MSKIRNESQPGLYGTALHATLDDYIEVLYGPDGFYLTANGEPGEHHPALLLDFWERRSGEILGWGSDYYEQGISLLHRWMNTRALPYQVLSREVKETFDLVVPGYEDQEPQKITYIMDRLDRRPDGSIEIIDYKSQWANLTSDTLSRMVQPALYAAAVRRKYGEAPIIVTFDMLRYGLVQTTFDDTQIDRFESWLGHTAAMIYADDDPVEKINSKCSFCPRKADCDTLARATEIGWTQTLPLEVLVAKRAQAADAKKAMDNLVKEIDEVLLAQMNAKGAGVIETPAYNVEAVVKRSVKYDPEVVLRVLGDEAVAFLTVGKTALDKELFRKKNNRWSPEQREEVLDMAQESFGEPTVKIESRGGRDDLE